MLVINFTIFDAYASILMGFTDFFFDFIYFCTADFMNAKIKYTFLTVLFFPHIVEYIYACF